MKKITYFILPIFAISSATGTLVSSNDLLDVQQEIIKTPNSNPNNHPHVDYNNGDNHNGVGGNFVININENTNVTQLEVDYFYIFVTIKDGIDWNDFYKEVDYLYFTLYDVTYGQLNPIETIRRTNGEQMKMGAFSDFLNQVSIYTLRESKFKFQTPLMDFHQYKVGFNINKADDLKFYSDYYELSSPDLNHFEISTTENNMTFEWSLATSLGAIRFEFNEIYAKINGKKYVLGVEAVGKHTISDLKSKTRYSVLFGYNARKIINPDKYYNINHEEKFSVSTSLPSNYSEATIIASLVLLSILIVIFFALLGIIIYWNNQRKKITGLSLIRNEDSEYNHFENNVTPNSYDVFEDYESNDYNDDREFDIEEWDYE